MTLRNIRLLHILWQESLGVGMLDGVSSGIRRILSLAGVYNEINWKYVGKRREPNWRNPDGTPKQYQSLDWHIELARKNSKRVGYLNSTELLDSLIKNPTYNTELRYELVVVNEPLHYTSSALRSVNGVARQGHGSVITLNPYLPLLQPVTGETDGDEKKRHSDFFLRTQMLTMHELGHVFGIFAETTSQQDPTDKEIKELHCQNNCVMHTYREIDFESEINNKTFCPSCLEKLKQYFIEP